MDARLPEDFGSVHFGACVLGDERRTKRLVSVANRVMDHPTGTWPQRLSEPADLDAFYRLVNREEVTHAAVLAAHRDVTLSKMREQTDVVLVIHDTTECDYSGLSSIDLNPIGNGHGRGYLCHNSLAVTAQGEVLGLVNQILFERPKAKKKEKKRQSARRPDRESRLWKRGVEAIPNAPEGRLWVDVADRGADITEFLAYEVARERKFLVRSKANRKLVKTAENTSLHKLHDRVRELAEQGRRSLQVRPGPGRAERQAELSVAFAQMQIVPPRQARGEHGREPITVWVIRVWESAPPEGEEGLEWILLSNVPVHTVEEAWRCVDWYKRRWLIEEYHKTMKSGCSIEQMQFTTAEALQPAIALVSVVAVGLLWLREVSRTPESHTRKAQEWFPRQLIRVLAAWRFGIARDDLSVHEFCLALARLGGHQNKKHQPPGLIVLWRGWTKLQLMTEGAGVFADTSYEGT